MRIAFLQESFRSGGVQKIILVVAGALANKGHLVDLLVMNEEGPLKEQIPESIRVVKLASSGQLAARWSCLLADPIAAVKLLKPILLTNKPSHTLGYLPDLVRYLRQFSPDVLFAAKPFVNVEAVLARRLAKTSTRLVLSERTHLSAAGEGDEDTRRKNILSLLRYAYLQADNIIAVSRGVADDLVRQLDLPVAKVSVIYNPTVTPEIAEKARQPVNHPWFMNGGPPVILSVGRIGAQKDYPTLLRAFARLRADQPVRLAVIGESRTAAKREKRVVEIVALARELGVAEDFSIIGYQPNPYAYMARASVLALSSRYEGFPNVILEALACGCPVVSTDCPSGPDEILDGGRFGRLVPVGDFLAMAEALRATLAEPPDRELLLSRSREFSFEKSIDAYERILVGEGCAAGADRIGLRGEGLGARR